ncbi:Morphology and auto-aggregation control protein [Thalassovita gelatinovora]|uniref:Morphology and auto-aggregation control protein n=1 Tax=Thalassovita gelatinovora TaxID=53501 RepID=A0A0P1FGZ5_THAGE|nr:LysR substrate-binding domain-containing protein [Thalassovita gelatinovora]QIZ81877.1 LysR family transcriptional regulator [Thalassovita gelatinovora]CUH67204.1 Morphology and auto-aggregation control protein [Thalassovita gelatinovora]SEP78489.1 LysR family transcriptional regulator, hydrogen peroxide-inducible genes activator [Thalassovita gelatinovora]
MITLRQLRFLTAVAETLNFSRAAETCFVTQPTLSAGIKELEDRLGVQLIERTRRSVLLTPLGEEITTRARRLLLDAGEIETLAQAHRNPAEGDLKLGSIPTIGPYLLPPALPAIRNAFPELRVYLREEMTESLIEGLTAGRLDLILIALPFETGPLEILPLFEDGYQLASPSDWPTPHGAESLTQSGQLMLLEKGHCLQRHALNAYPGRIFTAEDSFAATSLTTLIAMVSEGLGITLLPNLAVAAGVVGTAQVQLTPLPDACPRRVVLAWRPGSARAELFRKLGTLLQRKGTEGLMREQGGCSTGSR